MRHLAKDEVGMSRTRKIGKCWENKYQKRNWERDDPKNDYGHAHMTSVNIRKLEKCIANGENWRVAEYNSTLLSLDKRAAK